MRAAFLVLVVGVGVATGGLGLGAFSAPVPWSSPPAAEHPPSRPLAGPPAGPDPPPPPPALPPPPPAPPPPEPAPSAAAVAFGADAGSLAAQRDAGVPPDFGSLWIGPWTLRTGWEAPDERLEEMGRSGVTPAIHFYYWGDDMSPACLRSGCWSDLHEVHKTRAEWQRLAEELVDHLDRRLAGKPVLVLVETEFNKGSVATHEALDGYLAEKVEFLRAGYPAAQVALVFGNWNRDAWPTFDRAAAASDFVGVQALRGSTREASEDERTLYESTLAGARAAARLFGKPVVVPDLGLSTYPEPAYLQPQADELQEFFWGLPALKEAGVRAILYRSWRDTPTVDSANYYVQAERHWGLAYDGSGELKPAAHVWVEGVKAERASSAPPSLERPLFVAFGRSPFASATWIQVDVRSDAELDAVAVRVNGGDWRALAPAGPGSWATAAAAPAGDVVQFRAEREGQSTAFSGEWEWLTERPFPAAATFQPRSVGNLWWIDVEVTSGSRVVEVQASVRGIDYFPLEPTAWGTWAASVQVPRDARVLFWAVTESGETAFSPAVPWR